MHWSKIGLSWASSVASRRNLLFRLRRTIRAGSLALTLLTGVSQSHGATLVWTNSTGNFADAFNWDPAQSPAGGDTTLFTNDVSYTVNFISNSPAISSSVISNHSGVVTFNPNGFTWQVTNTFRVGLADSTTTVYLAGGTLAVASAVASNGQLRIGDATTNIFNCVSTMIVTNGTVAADSGVVGADATSVGTLIITGNGVYRDGGTGNASTLTVGAAGSSGSQLIVTNGGKLFVDGTLTVGGNNACTNNSALFSGPTSGATITGAGAVRFNGASGRLVISNGAKLFTVGSLLFGVSSSANTGIVVGTGSALIAQGAFHVGVGSSGGTNNYFLVYDGGLLSCDGTLGFGNGALEVNDGLQIGGPGAMSTGLLTVVRSPSNNTNHFGNFVTVTNAFVSCAYLNPQGPLETISVLANGTWKLTNGFAFAPAAVSSNGVNMGGVTGSPGGTVLMINGGTLINLFLPAENNPGGINLGGAAGNISLIVTNGGKLLTSMGTIGAGTSGNTGIVAGVGSVWSNYSGPAGFTNVLIVGTRAGGSNNLLGVYDGGTLYNNGTLNIGNNPTATVNSVRFGGPGASALVINTGSLNIGSAGGTYGNKLTVTNATLNCGTLNVGNSGATNNLLEFRGGIISASFVRVRPTNTVVFNAGTLGVGGLTFDTLANNGEPFVAGDGTSAATYDMANGGTGYHNFNNGGLVVTNGASLRGNGTLVGNVTVLGTFAPGFSVGSVYSSNNLVFGNSATLNYDLGTNSDSVTVNGDLTLGGTINVTDSGGFGEGVYILFTHTNTVSGTLAVGTMPLGLGAAVFTNSPPYVYLVVSPIVIIPWDPWRQHYFPGGGASSAGTADPDGDGVSNTNEFLAGFDPTDSSAYPHIISITKSETNVTITYLGASGDNTWSPGVASRTNVLEFAMGTANGSYSNNFVSTGQTNILSSGTGLGTITSFVDTNGASGTMKYYRVRVLVP